MFYVHFNYVFIILRYHFSLEVLTFDLVSVNWYGVCLLLISILIVLSFIQSLQSAEDKFIYNHDFLVHKTRKGFLK